MDSASAGLRGTRRGRFRPTRLRPEQAALEQPERVALSCARPSWGQGTRGDPAITYPGLSPSPSAAAPLPLLGQLRGGSGLGCPHHLCQFHFRGEVQLVP